VITVARHEEGFSLVEVIIAMFLLAVIALAILPALVQGARLSSEQSTTATATRALNALVEQARDTPTCANLEAVADPQMVVDGAGREIRTSGTVDGCPGRRTTVTLELTAVTLSGAALSRVSAIVFVP
jgi:prepilin-type N-terminal cleavage/methylation domain-containing protein